MIVLPGPISDHPGQVFVQEIEFYTSIVSIYIKNCVDDFRFPFLSLRDLNGFYELDQVCLRRKVSGDVSLEEGTHL